ncbi:diiron oxygenase [Streptomyces vinaceus]|uniref:diiron oxygenase n=1 Tax=Streptomyces vinaceus TaxID=1960 RepID=UPI00369A433B
MCGIIGLFTGCQAVTFCPRASARVDPAASSASAAGPADEYRSPFRSWYDRASVRRAPRRTGDTAEDPVHYFPPDHVPVAAHPLVKALAPDLFEQVLIQHLYRYQDFTSKLEHLVVNRTAMGIAHGTIGVRLPEEMRLDAYKVYCDEAYHALSAAEVIQQVRDRTDVEPRLPAQPYFLTRLEQILQSCDQDLRPLVEILFVVVSETLISGNLADIPDDPGVLPMVSEVVRDHAVDEGRHHTYFAIFLRHLWGQLDERTRRRAGRYVPQLIETFLAPDTESIEAELRDYGMGRDQAAQVVAEVFSRETVLAFGQAAARQTVRHFAGLGVLEDPRTAEEFHRYGLLEPASATSAPVPALREQ